jgi:hypothetical protein
MELELKDAWGLQRVQVYSEIMLHLEDEPCMSIMGTQDPKEAWDKLDRITVQPVNNQMTLMSELGQMCYNGPDILEYKRRMDSL